MLDFQSRTYIRCPRASSPRFVRSRMPHLDTGNTGLMSLCIFVVVLRDSRSPLSQPSSRKNVLESF